MSHTPGPWIVCKSDNDPTFVYVEQDGENLAEQHGEPSIIGEIDLTGQGIDGKTGLANARLIASAPELLATLQQIYDECDEELWEEVDSIDDGQRISVSLCALDLKRIRDVIKKARGFRNE